MGTRPKIGGARRDRTVDLLHAMQALSQLSYGPVLEVANCRKAGLDCQRFVCLEPGSRRDQVRLALEGPLSDARRRKPRYCGLPLCEASADSRDPSAR